MAKQLNVSLAFTADTSKAKKDIQDLQSQLTNLIQIGNKQDSTLGLSKSIQNATQKAAELKSILSSAVNINTGNLDLSKFSESLQRNNRSLSDYQKALSSLGPEGNRAFLSLAQSINKAEVPLKRTNGLVSELWTTLKNTARWQLSSSVLHSFMGSLQSAYGYAQNLNQSLNNIRIVTGYNATEMAKFAESANKAAQSLSTTTTQYTDAALIYYQQGIRDQEEIADRTETTIKLANVSRQSAEEVSSQMTAIWNNFDDGSHSLEYYADVITALGATTASSSQEIAKGMQQFAAVAETVGLSYDYAAASLATIVATTRQSESTVGNGLRTIFSRLEGLKLGDTLEDGTDLNKYSAALATIGVDIKDVSGNLKDMDIILEETASKWDTLDKAQKVAFATTVGGVRQYTNLIALLDNWDMVQENLNTARNSEGTLDQQAEIYAESWEAARKRVKSAAENIYDSLIDEDFFITIDNGLAKFLNQISNLIKGLGGLKGVLATVLTLVSQLFNNQISQSLDNMVYSLKMSSEKGRQSIINDKKRVNDLMINSSIDADTTSGSATAFAFEQQGIASNLVLENVSKMSVLEKEVAQQLLDQNATLAEETISLGEQLEQQQAISNTLEKRTNIFAKNAIQNGGNADPKSFIAGYEVLVNNLKNANQQYYNLETAVKRISAIKPKIENIDKFKITISSLQEQASNAGLSLEEAFGDKGAKAIEKLNNIITTTPNDINAIIDAQQNLNSVLDGNLTHIDFLEERLRTLLTNAGVAPQQIDSIINNLKTSYEDLGVKTSELAESQERLKNNTNSLKTFLGQINGESMTLSSSMVSLFGTITSLSMAINTLKGIGQVWSDEDTSILDKVLSTTMALGIAIPMLTRALNQENIQKTASALASISMAISDQTATAMSIEATVARKAESLGLSENTAAKLANVAATLALHAPLIAVIAALGALVGIIYAVNKAYNKSADDAKKASKAAKGLKEQYQKTKDSYEELKKSVEDHDNAVKAIDKLKHGTEEWRDAIQEANEKVLELIGNYPQLAAAVNRGKDGILTIDQNSSVYQDYLKAEKQRMNSSFAGSVAGNIIANNANYTNDLVQASRKMWYQNGTTQTQEGEVANYSQVSEAQLRQAVNLFNKDKSLFVKGQEDKLAEALNTTNTNLCTALINNVSAIEKLATELSANTTANQLAAEQIGMAAFKEQNSNIDDKYIQAVSGMLGGNYQEALERANNKWMDAGKFGSGPSDEVAQQEYAKEMGYTWKKNLGNNMGRYTDDKGQTIEIDDAVAREYLAVRDATAEISGNLNSAKQAIDNLQIGAKNLGNEIGDKDSAFGILTGTSGGKDFNFSNLTEEQFEGIKKAWKAASKDGSMTGEEFLKYFGISDEYARSKGYKSGLAMAQAFANGINNYANDVKYKNILDSLMPTAKPFEEASANYNTITSAGSKITDDNYILDDKSYQELEAAGIAVDQYFEQMADGTHLLTSSVSDFKSVVDSIATSELYTALTNQEKITGSLEAYSASGADSSLLADQDKNNILQFSGVSSEDVANIQIIEDSTARSIAYAEKFKELNLDGNIERINELLQQSADETQKIQDAIENSQFKDKVTDAGLDLEETIEYSKYLQRLAKNEEDAYIGADKLSKELIDNDQAAKNLSLQVQKMNKGVESLSKNWKNWSDMLQNSSKGSKEYYDALDDTREALSDLLDISEDFIDDEFVDSLANNTDSMKLMEEAAKGDGDAIDALRQKTLDNLILNLEINSKDLDNNTLLERVHGLQQMLDEMGPIEAGATIDTSGLDAGEAEFIAALNKLIVEAGMGKEAVNAMLSGMGYTANFASEPQTVKQRIQHTNKHHKIENYQQDPETGAASWDEVETVDPPTYEYIDGNVDAFAFETSEPGTTVVPKIESITKNASGSANNSSSSNKGGSGGGKGGGGGGGGKGSKPKTKDKTKIDESKLKKEDDEIERYHKIRNELEDITHELTMIGKAKDRAFGRNKIKQLDAETTSLKKQSDAQKRYLQEIQDWLEKDNAKAKEFGFEIDATGLVTNYEENMRTLMNKADEEYKAHVAKLNEIEEAYDALSAAGDETAEDIYKKAKEEEDEKYKKLEEYYENAKKALAKQEETHDLFLKKQEELKDTENAIYDNGVYRIAYAVELKIDVKDRDIALLEDLLEDIGDKADGACDAIANFGNQLEDTLDKIDTYTQEVSDILEHAGADEDLIDRIMNNDFDEDDWEDVLNIGQNGEGLNETEIEHLKNVADALLQSNKEMRKLREEALKKTGEAFDEFNEQLSRSVGQIEHLTTVTQTYRDVLDIVGKDVLDRNGKLTDALNKQTYNIQRNHTHALQAQLDFIDTALDKAQALYDEAVENGYNQKTLESLKADVEKYEDERQATYEEWLDSWKQECQIAKDYYEDTLSQILHDFEDMVAGQFKNLSGLSEEFARKNEIADIYVDDYEKIYQLSKLNRDINNSLDDSTTLASKGKLRDIQKEINELQESGVEVSQYDLDVLRKKYEMALAYEQWQDAQNAKTVVRMQRDNEGNYGYVYTADESDVEAAEQNYEDKLHEMQVLNAEYIQSLQEQIIQAQQDCADALANLRAEDFASYEEYQDAVRQIREDYTKRIQTLSQQMNNAMDNNRTLYEEDWTAYSQATGYKISADEDYIDKFEETMYAQLTGFNTMEEAQDAFVGAMGDATDAAAENWEDWYIRTNTALDDAGLSMQNFTDEVGDRVEQLGDEAARAEDDVWNMSDEFSDAYSDISDTVANFLDEYSNYIDAMIDANRALVESINQVIAAYAELNGEENDNEDFEPDDYQWVNLKEGTGEYEWAYQSASTGKRKIGDFEADYTLEDGRKYRASYTSNESGILQASEENSEHNGYYGAKNVRELTETNKKSSDILSKVADATEKIAKTMEQSNDNSVFKHIKNLEDPWGEYGLASGGYTGSWGSSGKLAMLHEKELVLNKEDTSNILSAVDMIRSISNTIDLNALAAGAAFTGRSSATLSTFGSKESLEQNVHITAEFPSVSDHNEIEQALNSLVERAAQFAGRKKF